MLKISIISWYACKGLATIWLCHGQVAVEGFHKLKSPHTVKIGTLLWRIKHAILSLEPGLLGLLHSERNNFPNASGHPNQEVAMVCLQHLLRSGFNTGKSSFYGHHFMVSVSCNPVLGALAFCLQLGNMLYNMKSKIIQSWLKLYYMQKFDVILLVIYALDTRRTSYYIGKGFSQY